MEDGPVFEKTIALLNGVGSDIQLFGSAEERFRTHPLCDTADCLWSLVRQEIFYGHEPKPCVVLHWLHTLNKITLVDVIPVGDSRIQKNATDPDCNMKITTTKKSR
jgi:hypothetical protein